MRTILHAGRVGVGLAALAMAATACGASDPSAEHASTTTSTSTAATASTTATSTAATPPSTTATSPTTATSGGPSTSPPNTAPTTSQLGPQWTQADGRVLIEAIASADAQQLLADLVALGLTDGVAYGRVVNGWLPVESFDDAQHLASLKFLQPTGAGTGAGS